MKRILNLIVVGGLVAVFGCSKDSTTVAAATGPTSEQVRVIVTMPTAIMASDIFVLAGSFTKDAWTPDKSTTTLVKQPDGTFSVDVSTKDFDKKLEFKVVRNPKNGTDAWLHVEKDAKCDELAGNRTLDAATQGGKEVKIKVENFRGTGTCPK